VHSVECCGDIPLEAPKGQVIFHGVLCIPKFVVNLLSVPQLDLQGYSVVQGKERADIYDAEGKRLLSGNLKAGLYTLDCSIKPNSDEEFQPKGKVHMAASNVGLWHRRLGHPGMHATREFLNGNAVLGLMHETKASVAGYCEVCRNSKEHRAHFGPSSNPPTAPLQVIHSDVMGPFKCRSIGGHQCTCSLYDQFSVYASLKRCTLDSFTLPPPRSEVGFSEPRCREVLSCG
jgi:hypothetical protein